MTSRITIFAAAFAAIAIPAGAHAQDLAGRIEYERACASCHGETAGGDGPVSTFLNVKVPDLTRISARNDGKYPFQDLIEMIDGRDSARQIGAHGISMPVWGDRFMAESGSGNEVENEINTLGRVASLVYYLYGLQQ